MESFRVTFFGSPLCCLSTPILISDLILLPVLFFLKQAGELHIFVLREEKEGKESHTRQPA